MNLVLPSTHDSSVRDKNDEDYWSKVPEITVEHIRQGLCDPPAIMTVPLSEEDPFVVTKEEALRRGPILPDPEGKKYEAYIIFHGRQMGVFRSW